MLEQEVMLEIIKCKQKAEWSDLIQVICFKIKKKRNESWKCDQNYKGEGDIEALS